VTVVLIGQGQVVQDAPVARLRFDLGEGNARFIARTSLSAAERSKPAMLRWRCSVTSARICRLQLMAMISWSAA
jgi:hypothetical protein